MTELSMGLKLTAEPLETEQSHPIHNARLSETVSQTTQQWVNELLMAMRNTKCDFLGLGARIAISNPKEMTASPLPWTQLLETLPMTAHVECNIAHEENDSRTKEEQA